MSSIKAWVHPHRLKFKEPAGTSRGTLYEKQVYYLLIKNQETGETGIGECTTLPGLSLDERDDYPEKVEETAKAITEGKSFEAVQTTLHYFPSVLFGLETAFKDLENGGKRIIFDTPFAHGRQTIPINGLIWMNDYKTMLKQVREKIHAGFDCLKVKLGAIEWEKELSLLAHIRADYPAEKVEIRVDANGAFTPGEVMKKLRDLTPFQIHSIEQPIAPRQPELMARLCKESPIPIALDEELIGRQETENKKRLLENIRPQHIVLKPSLIGGFQQTEEWVNLAKSMNSGWWVTSALESNIALNAIAQWVSQWEMDHHQGLGTGGLYTNNISSPLEVKKGLIWANPEKSWDLTLIQNP